jgi:aminopeptidase N
VIEINLGELKINQIQNTKCFQAAFDFSETETMLQKAEELCGPYVWGVYDILVLPPSFPYGGMENPCLTFATPTLLVGVSVSRRGLTRSKSL